MSSVLPSRRFRDVQVLIGTALVLLVTVAVAQLQAISALHAAAMTEAVRATDLLAGTMAVVLRDPDAALSVVPLAEGDGAALVTASVATERIGAAGPETPGFWPWPSRQAWETAGRTVSSPVESESGPALVAYRLLPGGRAVRLVHRVPPAAAGRWPRTVGVLALAVAGGGAIIAWLLLARALAPYRELLDAASRVGTGVAGKAEDRFLVETFRATIERLERSEAELRRRADELEVLADVLTRESSSGVVLLDREGRVRGVNATAERLVGCPIALGTTPPAQLHAVRDRMEIGARTVEVRRQPLLAAGGAVQGEVVFLIDRTRELALERALAEREGMAVLGELAAGMAHELRNALATMTGYLRLLADADDSKRDRYIAAMQLEASDLGAVLERFLRFAQPRELRREPVDIARLVRERADQLHAAFPDISFAVNGDAANALVDAAAVTVAIDNLLRNAAEASATSRTPVDVAVTSTADRIEVRIEDRGPGVSPELESNLFAPFTTTKASGGLGLALARRFARLHGGDVGYAPRPGGGSSFSLILPREESA